MYTGECSLPPTHVCTCVPFAMYMHTCVHVCVHVFACRHMCIPVCVCMCAHMFGCLHVHACVCLCACVCVCACVYVFACLHVHACMCVRATVCLYDESVECTVPQFALLFSLCSCSLEILPKLELLQAFNSCKICHCMGEP